MQVLLAFTTNWTPTGGIDQYVQWAGGNLTHGDFFNNTAVMDLYKGFVAAVINRTNVYTGRKYVAFLLCFSKFEQCLQDCGQIASDSATDQVPVQLGTAMNLPYLGGTW